MKKIWELYQKHREVISYLFWGGIAFVLSVLLFWIFNSKLGMGEVLANTIDWIILVIFTFFTNKLFVFRSKAGSPKAFGREFVSFVLARLFTLLLEDAIIWVGCNKLGFNSEIGSLIVKLIAQFVVIVSNYILSKLIVFRHKKTPEQTDVAENIPVGSGSETDE
ncbi:MAG: GtrA family protein [Lachnospiraceae bacterium]|nr:GtrA family protein [Lachnospiraceae bacterium]